MQEIVSLTTLKMTTREIAELTGKEHSHVYRDAIRMFEQLNYSQEQIDQGHQKWRHPQNKQEYYLLCLNREETECLISGYSAPLRMKIIKRLRELEGKQEVQKFNIPQTLPEALRLAADLADQLAIQAPKVAVYEQLADRKSDVSTTVLAKHLSTTAIKLNQFLRDKGVKWLNTDLPKAGYMDYFNVISDVKNGHEFHQCLITPLGQIEITKLWLGKPN